ncbi:uncharacterized protein LOC105186218 isoform X3 [Harpegnathos saltator]|uniref:uncharacterized protein LOC105186218 isoform X3 n=1 Tax=Harpegnathos saltator TaxID=610380 RepID=UPI00058DA1A0|nr:uncharacterized protein LOC105186218 isoform X3 [Harpegnathos saltator]
MMIVLLLCIIMKIAEFSAGRTSPPLATMSVSARPPPLACNRRCRRCKRHRSPNASKRKHRRQSSCNDKCTLRKFAGEGPAVMEDPQTPGSDCNSNPATDSIQQDLIGSEFVQDNVEYQWFIDYGYRDGGLHIHPSVLSSLSASYSPKDLGYYDDLARNLDANLAEIDMESFRTADIHTLLTALPVMCTEPVQHSEGEDSACSTADTISICKSSLLFSPLKETPVLPPGGSYSVDSLDCEDMLLTCQTNNKNNYTIAFEGSITMYSDGSQDFENHDKHKTYESSDLSYDKQKNAKAMLDLSMACSDSKIYTTWSNLKHSSMNKVITRHPSGNNNTMPDILQSAANLTLGGISKRSQSLPDLSRVREFQHTNIPLNFSVDSAESSNPIQRLQSSGSAMSRSTNAESSDNGDNACTKKLQNLSLVRLFMKQKSMSVEGMSLTLDQSDSISDNGWPTSNSGSDSATNTNTQIQRQNQDNNRDRHVAEDDFSINWIRRDMANRDTENPREMLNFLKCASPIKDDKIEMTSSASVEELSESISKSGCTSGQMSFDIINSPFEQQQKNGWVGMVEKKYPICRTTGIQANAEMEDNAVQTSLIFIPPTKDQGPLLQETIVNKKPVYVVYPNYTLPDLSFLNIKDTKVDNVALKPHTFDKNKTEWKRTVRTSRPFSCNDIDALRQRGFAHIKDWESLTFLLPNEYKKILHDVPEVSRHINMNEEVRRPLFCLSPPMRHKGRPISEIVPNNTSSTSSTATQPSSGYRGSSTILTDSSTNQQQPLPNNAVNPLYLYRYDSISSEASLVNNDKKMHRLVNHTRQACPILPKRSVSLPQGDGEPDFNNSRVPPRPPLPRSILRKNKVLASKRYSMFEMGDVGETEEQAVEVNKRMSLQEPYYMNNDLQLLCRGRTIDSEKDVDETEEERYHIERLNEATNTNAESRTSQHSDDDVKQLEDYLKRSGLSSQSSDGDTENADVKLRSYVRKFLALRMNKEPLVRNVDMGELQRKTVSFAVHQREKHTDPKPNNLNVAVNEQNQDQMVDDKLMELEEKKKMVSSVNKAVDLLLKYWNADTDHTRHNYNEKNECAQICLSNLCPALYAMMSDGLKPHLNSTFGPITNSVWQVVEASSQQGPLTKTLNELVQRINGEDVITEGMLKFHAFVFGLLNLRALDAWFAYLCTRESILRKHYSNSSLFVGALANSSAREVVDSFLYILNPLAFCPFHLDLLYQYRQLQNSFGSINSHAMNAVNFRNADMSLKKLETEESESYGMVPSPKKIRPRSCIAYDDKCGVMHKGDPQNMKKRFSGALSSKTFYALDKLTSEDSEDYTDSLEHSPLNRATSRQPQHPKLQTPETKASDEDGVTGETKFRKLQEKWELMIGKESSKNQPALTTPPSPARTFGALGKSKIPRLLTSPVKQSNTTPIAGRPVKSPVSEFPWSKTPTAMKAKPKKPVDTKMKDVTRRTSRVDQDALGAPRIHTTRPSSLPYKSFGITSNDKNPILPHRRAASTSLPRPNVATVSRNNPVTKPRHRKVRTLTHSIPSDTGHLSFVEGEKLKVILEVDDKWLLCAKGDRRGLVPRAYVHSVPT